jgi:glycerate kinase
MSAAAGMWRIAREERNPLSASTFGVGEMILDAVRRGAVHIIAGLGGSATNDGGAGMAAALGYRFLTSDGEPVEPIPANLLALTSIRPPELELPAITAACDVRNPLLGPSGASRVYGPQKGADAAAVALLESALENLADVAAHDLGCDFRNVPGAGAAGGLGFGMLTFCSAQLRPGFEVVAECLGLESKIIGADLVITGEGSLDAQTLEGKAPAGVAALARRHGRRVIAFAGVVCGDVRWSDYFDAVHALSDDAASMEESIRDAANLLEQSTVRTAKSLSQSGMI